MKRRPIIFIIILFMVGIFGTWTYKSINLNPNLELGQKIDSLNGVYVYYNGGVGNVSGRNTTSDGYNVGLKYQCVEFVKRFYWEELGHKMPDTYGHAKDFFDKSLADGQKNQKRDLFQYTNTSKTKPQINDLIVFESTLFNRYGHVAIISAVTDDSIEIIQQNPGPNGKSRKTYNLLFENSKWRIDNSRVLGWLRK
jgi:surface antigen